MERDLTDEELDAIWDDESGIPPPMTADEMDARLEASTESLRQQNAEATERHEQVLALVARKEAFVEKLRQTVADMERERSEIIAIEKRLRIAGRKELIAA